jgi:endonuclease/exonuclease/phosphatase family metal-dependent hydrolase
MPMRFFLIFVIGIVSLQVSFGQEGQKKDSGLSYRIVFYNVENFFDPYVDSTKSYNEFTPEGNLHWTYNKYVKKRNDVYKTLTAIGEWKPLTIVGFAEVENFLVLYELIKKTPLKYEHYKIVHYESEDFRGIDVGVIYNADLFHLLSSSKIKIRSEQDTAFKTRDIIYLKGLLGTDTLHVFFNHWTSRYRGMLESEAYRMLAAETLMKVTDSVCRVDPGANILIMGDFNDNPENESLQHLVHDTVCHLSHLTFTNTNKDVNGTLKHHASWSYFDQAIVSESLISAKNGLRVADGLVHVFDTDFLLTKDEKYLGLKTYRTNIGFKYNGGISDHLPVYVDILSRSSDHE